MLNSPALAPFFAPETLAEVPVCAEIEPVGRINGIIDRLIVTATTVTAIDFKSNRTVPNSAAEVPEGLLRQMGAYHAALKRIYPDHAIETGLVWTAGQTFMPLPHDLVVAALARATAA